MIHSNRSMIAVRRIAVIVCLMVAWAIVLAACSDMTAGGRAQGAYTEPLLITSGRGVHVFRVERAVTPDARARGLMYRRSMPADAGMIFYFERPRPASMWMKNTYIPLDMLFLDSAGLIVDIHRNAEPHSTRVIRSAMDVRGILELNAGTAARLKLRPGDAVRHALFGNLEPGDLPAKEQE